MPFSCSFFDALESCSNSPKTGAKSLSATGCYPSPKESTHRLTGRNMGHFGWGWYHYPRTVSHVSETLRGQGVERQTLPLLGLGRGCSQRTQRAFGTAMRLCASLFRGVAAPLGCVIFFYFCQNCDFYALRTQGLSACARRGGITTLSALCALPKRWTTACQSGLFAVFLRPLLAFMKAPAGYCQYPH